MNPNNAWKLELRTQKTNIGVQKIDCFALKTFGMVVADFKIKDKASKPRFFQKIFLVANIKFEVILKMFFFKISNVDISFDKKTLI